MIKRLDLPDDIKDRFRHIKGSQVQEAIYYIAQTLDRVFISSNYEETKVIVETLMER